MRGQRSWKAERKEELESWEGKGVGKLGGQRIGKVRTTEEWESWDDRGLGKLG